VLLQAALVLLVLLVLLPPLMLVELQHCFQVIMPQSRTLAPPPQLYLISQSHRDFLEQMEKLVLLAPLALLVLLAQLVLT
jgi:hypothetical protein